MMDSFPTSLDQDCEAQSSTGKQFCCYVDRSADSDYESELSNLELQELEMISAPEICQFTEGSSDSSLFRCLQSLEVETEMASGSCPNPESRVDVSLCVGKSINPGIPGSTAINSYNKTISSSLSSNKCLTKIAVNGELEPSYCNESERAFENHNGFPGYVEHRGSGCTTDCVAHEGNVFPSILECSKLALPEVVGFNSSSTSIDHISEIQTSSGKGFCFSFCPPIVPDLGSVRLANSHEELLSRHLGVLEGTGSLSVAPVTEGSYGPSSSVKCIQTIDVAKVGRATSEPWSIPPISVPKLSTSSISSSSTDIQTTYSSSDFLLPSSMKAQTENCDWECAKRRDLFKYDYSNPNNVEKGGFECTSNALPFESHVSQGLCIPEQLLAEAADMNLFPQDLAIDKLADISHTSCMDGFNTSKEPLGYIDAEGSNNSSPSARFSKIVGINQRVGQASTTLGRAKSEPRTPIPTPYVDDSRSYRIRRSTSISELGSSNTVSSSQPSNNHSLMESLIPNSCTAAAACCVNFSGSENIFSNDSLNCEDQLELTHVKSQPKSIDVAGAERVVLKTKVNENLSLRNSNAESLSKVASTLAQISQVKPTPIEDGLKCTSPSLRIPQQLTHLRRAKSEPIFTGLFADAMVNRRMTVRSNSLNKLDVPSLEMSSQLEKAYQYGIGDTYLRNHTQIDTADILARVEALIEEEGITPVIKSEPIDDEYCWGQSFDAPYDEHVCYIKEEPPDELPLKNCRVALQRLPAHILESYLQEEPWENNLKKKRRLWEPKTSNKKRKAQSTSHANSSMYDVDLRTSPNNKFIVQHMPSRNIKRKKRRLWEPKKSNKKRNIQSNSHVNASKCCVSLKTSLADKFNAELPLKECRIILEKLPDYKVLCLEAGIQDCSVVLDKLPNVLASYRSIRDCSVILNRLSAEQINPPRKSCESPSESLVEDHIWSASTLSFGRILFTRLGIKILPS